MTPPRWIWALFALVLTPLLCAQAYAQTLRQGSGLPLPRYVRLGKFMSKARVESREMKAGEVEKENVLIHRLLNPADLPAEARLDAFDLISVPPAPLIRNALISGRFYQLPGGEWLPVGMRFNVEKLP